MTNTKLLFTYMKKCGKNLEEISAELGISSAKLRRKMNGQEKFRASEIIKLTHLIPLDAAQTQASFFQARCDKQSQK